jgi:hypothetical protein
MYNTVNQMEIKFTLIWLNRGLQEKMMRIEVKKKTKRN